MKTVIILLAVMGMFCVDSYSDDTYNYEKVSDNIIKITKTETFDPKVTPDNTRIAVLKASKAELELAKIDVVAALDVQRASTIASYDAQIALVDAHIVGAVAAGVVEEKVEKKIIP